MEPSTFSNEGMVSILLGETQFRHCPCLQLHTGFRIWFGRGVVRRENERIGASIPKNISLSRAGKDFPSDTSCENSPSIRGKMRGTWLLNKPVLPQGCSWEHSMGAGGPKKQCFRPLDMLWYPGDFLLQSVIFVDFGELLSLLVLWDHLIYRKLRKQEICGISQPSHIFCADGIIPFSWPRERYIFWSTDYHVAFNTTHVIDSYSRTLCSQARFTSSIPLTETQLD